MNSFNARVSDIIYTNDINGYTVARVEVDDPNSFAPPKEIITGIMPGLCSGENIEVTGNWTLNKRFGRQFSVSLYKFTTPDTVEGIMAFLSSGTLKGIREKTAQRIVDKFGMQTLEVFDKNPEKLLEVKGIGKKTLKDIVSSYEKSKGVKNVIMFLSPYGITPNLCSKIYKRYENESIKILKENPYKLTDDLFGVGFKIADKIAMAIGVSKKSRYRVSSGIIHVLKTATNSGHVYLPKGLLLKESASLLDLDEEFVDSNLYGMIKSGQLKEEACDEGFNIYLSRCKRAEDYVCEKIKYMSRLNKKPSPINLDFELKKIEKKSKVKLAKKQKDAIGAAFKNNIMVLTGGPGTGKTTTLDVMIKLFEKAKLDIALAAPTGKAAKRMTEQTSKESKTIHRLLEVQSLKENGKAFFARDELNPIEADVVIVDESSMMDIFLMESLLKAIGKNTKLILVGDDDQLPSVGAGRVLNDIIESNIVTVVKLDEIFRQASESDIIVNAHSINRGGKIVANRKGGDFFFIEKDDDLEILSEIASLVGKRLEEKYKLDPLEDIQVLSPSRKGVTGVNNLNERLQEVLNPYHKTKGEVVLQKRIFRVGDKVMQTKNNYQKEWVDSKYQTGQGVFNGEVGYIYNVNNENKSVSIVFDGFKNFEYKYEELSQLEHCFATTVHKSQGSEYKVVVIPMTWSAPMLLNRKLLYTAVTRAKELVILVGKKKYLQFMISNVWCDERYSNLCSKLRKK